MYDLRLVESMLSSSPSEKAGTPETSDYLYRPMAKLRRIFGNCKVSKTKDVKKSAICAKKMRPAGCGAHQYSGR